MKTAFGGRLTLLALTLGACLVAWPLAADGELRGTPEVRDGDTIVLQGRRLRLDGIDAPELGQSCRIKSRLYDCGMVARTALLDLTAGAEVVCRPLGPGPGGLTLARCFADDYDLSEGMTYTGWALALRRPQNRYVAQEDGARLGKRGFWRGSFVAPWEWRAGKRLAE